MLINFKKFFLVLILFISVLFSLPASNNYIMLDDNSFDRETKDILVIVDFYADWCGPCRTFAPAFNKVAGKLKEGTFVKVDTDKSPRLSRNYNIKYIPYIVAMFDGKVIAQYNGNRTEDDFYQWSKKLIDKYKAKLTKNNVNKVNDKIIHIKSKDDFDTLNKKSPEKLIVADFYAVWCGPCKALAPIMSELSTEYNEVIFCKVDIDRLGDLAQEYNVQYIPHVVFIKNGKEAESLTGLYKKNDYIKIIEKYTK